jgi:UDPglucose 6-dehydrogenase
LRARGAEVLLNDPLYTEADLSQYADEAVHFDELTRCHAALMQACHDQYRWLDWQLLAQLGCRVVLDGRNCLDRQVIEAAGMTYLSIGR